MKPANQRLEEALKSSILAEIPAALIQRLMRDAIQLDVPAGGTIYHEDDEPRWGLVTDGLIRVYMASPAGRQVTVRYARPGDVLGVAAVVGGPAPVGVQMLTQATICFFGASALREMAQAESNVGWLLARELADRLYETLEILAEETFGTLRQRIARHLLDLAADHQRGVELTAHVNQQELADAVGSVRPAGARIIGELRAEGLVQTSSGGITIIDPSRLYAETWAQDR
ncbi:N/A [soil metagenome]